MNPRVKFACPKCRTVIQFDASKIRYLQQRESELAWQEQNLREREQRLLVREAEHETDVRLIRSCLHPDRHPQQADRYTRAWQAFERLLASSAKPADNPYINDDLPF